jgi:hypothetical protein
MMAVDSEMPGNKVSWRAHETEIEGSAVSADLETSVEIVFERWT